MSDGVRAFRRSFAWLVLILAGSLAFLGGNASANVPPGIVTHAATAWKIDPAVIAATEGGKSAQLMVLLTEQADLSAAYTMKDQDARGWYVYNTLRAHAEKSQASIKAYLNARSIPYRSFWAASSLLVTGDRALLDAIAARPDVAHIESNRPFKGIDEPADAALTAPAIPQVAEWGVQNVNAPQVWAMGFTGQGIVAANQDTGIRWTHGALRPKYRGWNGVTGDHNYNWWDAIHSGGGSCGPNTLIPCDDNGHGTHTMGTVSGDDALGNQVGVAPGSKWIGCRNMNQGVGTPATYTECFQFFIAPTDLTGQNADPSLRPHVMNNSWGCPTSEGCAANTLQAIVESTQAAGIFVEASAGNAGPSCGSVNDPPAIYAASFSTGAIDINNVLASFSSRGPVTVDGSNRLKPNVSAPGVNVRSSTRTSDTSYGSLSGTSMAGPHVVGVVALLWSARPDLTRMITETKAILQNTANPAVTVSGGQTCGGIPHTQIPNNSFGYGRVDVLAAVNSVPVGTATPTVTGTPPTNTPTRTPTRTPTFTPTPCGGGNYLTATTTGVSIVPGSTDTGNHCDDCTTSIALPFPYTLYDQTFNSVTVSSNGVLQFTGNSTAFSNACLPTTTFNNAILAHWDDLRTDGTGNGIFTSVSGVAPNRIFNIEWRVIYFGTASTLSFEVRLYEGQTRFDIIYGAQPQSGSSATVGVQRDTGSRITQFSCNTASLSQGLQIAFTLPACTSPTSTQTPGGPTNTPTRTSTPTPTNTPTFTRTNTPVGTPTPTFTPLPCSSYNVTILQGGINPGTTDIGNHCDDCITVLPLPFAFRLYNTNYTQGFVSSNGNVQFASNLPGVPNSCPPTSPFFPNTLMILREDLRTDCTGCGVFTLTDGTTPNRRFYIEWRAQKVASGTPVNIQIIMYESSPTQQVDFIYMQTPIVGGQAGIIGSPSDYTCYPNDVGPTFMLRWTYQGCPTATVTRTPTNTPTSTPTAQSLLVGHVTWQGAPTQPDPRQQQPVTLTLKLGTTEVNYTAQTTDSSGFFTVSLGTLPNGTYNWRAKGPHGVAGSNTRAGFLANTGSFTKTSAPQINVEMGLMRGGDANNDNIVNSVDFSLLRAAFGSTTDLRCDFTNDGIVNASDFNVLRGNFGVSGAPPAGP